MAKNTYKKSVPKKNEKGNFKIRSTFFTDEKFKYAVGLAFILVAVFLLISFLSYLFEGKSDQSVVEAFTRTDVKSSGQEVNNWFGLFGAITAHYFIFNWFGITALLIPPFLYNLGQGILSGRWLLSVRKSFSFVVFYLIWTSLFMGYIVINTDEVSEWGFLSGGIGFELAIVLDSLMGWGTTLFIIFLFLIFNMYFFNVTSMPGIGMFDLKLDALLGRFGLKDEMDEDEEEHEEEESSPLLVNSDLNSVIEKVKQEVEEEDLFEEIETGVEESSEELDEEEEDDDEWILGDQAKNKATDSTLDLEVETSDAPAPKEPDFTKLDKLDSLDTLDLSFDKPEPRKRVLAEDLEMKVEKAQETEVHTDQVENYDPTLDLPRYQYPGPDLLIDYPPRDVKVSKEELSANKDKIVETLINFKIGISSIKATIGPTVTLYEIVPEAGVKISKIKNLEDDIALSLAALGIRIIAPIPGKGTIGIEVPNKNREMVDAKSVITTEKFMKSDKDLPVVLGKTISNEVFVTDLAKMPHLLMAGATGQGKSVGLNVILASLLYKKHPSQIKFVLVDPKKVELTLFNKIERHFLARLPDSEESIITDTSKVVNTLNSLCIEMDTRYDLLKDAQCRNLKEYNKKFVNRRLNPKKGHRYLPYIVLVIDELADLMMTAGKEVETPIARLAQLARAIGIHLIVATQRPSVNVITGIIKANFPARLSFRVTSKVDSRTILDAGGAEQLIGQGDMLLSMGSEMIRLQCAFVDTPEVENICDFIGEQRGYDEAYQLPEFSAEESTVGEVDLADRDALFEDAARMIVVHQQGSTSLIQRKMKLGYNRAGRIIDQLEAAGIVGPFEGSKAREVLIKDEYSLEQLLNEIQ
ncbi:MAG: DNA translocase FtsK 4TM domain-containing protein [Cyclobacteriaceae bacterium]